MTRPLLLIAATIMLVIALALGGTSPFGRLAMGLDMPQIASSLFAEDAWKGASHYRAGRYDMAARFFTAAGASEAFNQGNALAHNGHYAAALEAYDLALAHDPQDAAARANFDLVSAFYAGTEIESGALIKWSSDRKNGPTTAADTAQGSARAAGTGDGVTNKGALVGLPELVGGDRLGVRKVFDDKFVVASPRWLATLEDVPGSFLAARIAHEQRRRAKAGVGQKEAEDPL